MRVAKELRQLDAFRKDDRLAQGLPHRVIGQREPGAERQDYETGKQWPSSSEAQQPGTERQWRDIDQQDRHRRPARTRDVPRQQPSARNQCEAGAELQQRERFHYGHGARMWKCMRRRIASPMTAGAISQKRIPNTSGHGKWMRRAP